MNYNSIINNFLLHSDLKQNDILDLFTKNKLVKVNKDELIDDYVNEGIVFLVDGLFKRINLSTNNITYFYSNTINSQYDSVDFIKNCVIMNPYAYVKEIKTSQFNYKCIEDSFVYLISYNSLEKLMEHDKLVEFIFTLEDYIVDKYLDDFIEKNEYTKAKKFKKNNKMIFSKLELCDISSYLNVSKKILELEM